MKKILPMLVLFGCTTEPLELLTTECFCEKVIYFESKFQDTNDNNWYVERTEVERIPVDCQNETDFTPTGEVQEMFRIECD